MSRIRTVKPIFFRHELLQDLENKYPENRVMLVYCGLWGQCDSSGAFEWRPRQLKLDILPFIPFEMEETLEILRCAGIIQRYQVAGNEYGIVPTFLTHQRLNGKEVRDGQRFPLPEDDNKEATEKQQRSNRARLVSQEKEKEKEKEKEVEVEVEVEKESEEKSSPKPFSSFSYEKLKTLAEAEIEAESDDRDFLSSPSDDNYLSVIEAMLGGDK